MLKIAYVSYSTIPSASANSIHVTKMSHAFASLHNDVVLFHPFRKSIDSSTQDVYGYYNVQRNFSIVQVGIPNVRGKSFFYAWKMAGNLKKLSPDIVYSRDLKTAAVALALGKKTVFESHFPVFDETAFQAVVFASIVTNSNLLKIVTISAALRDSYLTNYPQLTADRIFVAPDGADDPNGASATPMQWPGRKDCLQVGYVGHLYPGKGMEVVVELVKRLPELDFHVIGGSAGYVERWKSRLVGALNVFFHGHVPPGSVSTYMKNLDVCLLPNQKTVYGADLKNNIGKYTSPLKLFEYMAHRKAIVASDLPVLREILNETNAILVPPESPGDWASALIRLCDASVRQSLAEHAYQDFVAKYTWTERAARILQSLGVDGDGSPEILPIR